MQMHGGVSVFGFDPLGNPVPLGRAPDVGAESAGSYERGAGQRSMPNPSFAEPMDDVAWGRATPDKQSLEWYGWLENQWSGQGASPLEAEWSQNGLGRARQGSMTGSPKSGESRADKKAPELVSLSQQQMHTQSTAACYGPAAQKLFHQPGRSRQRNRSSHRSASPTLVRLGVNGHMRQRATTSHAGLGGQAAQVANQGMLGAGMMTQKQPWGRPHATWVDNRRVTAGPSGGASPLPAHGTRKAHRLSQLSQPATREQGQVQRALRQKDLRQKRQQRQQADDSAHLAQQQLGQQTRTTGSGLKTKAQRSRVSI